MPLRFASALVPVVGGTILSASGPPVALLVPAIIAAIRAILSRSGGLRAFAVGVRLPVTALRVASLPRVPLAPAGPGVTRTAIPAAAIVPAAVVPAGPVVPRTVFIPVGRRMVVSAEFTRAIRALALAPALRRTVVPTGPILPRPALAPVDRRTVVPAEATRTIRVFAPAGLAARPALCPGSALSFGRAAAGKPAARRPIAAIVSLLPGPRTASGIVARSAGPAAVAAAITAAISVIAIPWAVSAAPLSAAGPARSTVTWPPLLPPRTARRSFIAPALVALAAPASVTARRLVAVLPRSVLSRPTPAATYAAPALVDVAPVAAPAGPSAIVARRPVLPWSLLSGPTSAREAAPPESATIILSIAAARRSVAARLTPAPSLSAARSAVIAEITAITAWVIAPLTVAEAAAPAHVARTALFIGGSIPVLPPRSPIACCALAITATAVLRAAASRPPRAAVGPDPGPVAASRR